MKVTARAVAQRLGLSPATVSMVFRGKPGISAPVREKVLAAARDMGFQYGGAKAPPRANTIQLVFYKRHGKVVADTPFFEQLTAGVAQAVQALGYQLTISYFYGAENIAEQLRSLESARCAGIILLTTEMHTADLAPFDALDIPLVLLDNWFPTKRYDAVVIDNQRGALLATRYLIERGHTRLGYLHSKVDIRNFVERRDGYLSAVRAMKDPANSSAQRIIRVGTTIESAYEDMTAYLATDPVLPTAFFADNDNIAIGCMRALARAGSLVPQEVSVIGFDDMPICQTAEPPLTTIAVPKKRMGALAAERLDKLIRGETGGEVIRLAVLPEIIRRASVADLRRK